MKDMGQIVVHRLLADKEERLNALANKGIEEASEFSKNPSLDELADELETIKARGEEMGYDMGTIEKRRQQRFSERGGFDRGIYVETVELADSDPMVAYYANEPDRFPEVKK
jgi:predicted house-cleaning noncanonical NTP pyrophosphatase (MazG superfamily)